MLPNPATRRRRGGPTGSVAACGVGGVGGVGAVVGACAASGRTSVDTATPLFVLAKPGITLDRGWGPCAPGERPIFGGGTGPGPTRAEPSGRLGRYRGSMITVEEYLASCDRALDEYAAIARQLGDDLVNARLERIPGSNSAFALVAHAAGMAARWGRSVNRGIPVPRDRDGEFTATGTVEEALELVARTRAGLHEDARAASPGDPPADPGLREGRHRLLRDPGRRTAARVSRPAQHLGQLPR